MYTQFSQGCLKVRLITPPVRATEARRAGGAGYPEECDDKDCDLQGMRVSLLPIMRNGKEWSARII